MDRKDSSRMEKPLSASAMLASMDAPGSKADAKAPKPGKPNKNAAFSYIVDVDLPPSEEEEHEADLEAIASKPVHSHAMADLEAIASKPVHSDTVPNLAAVVGRSQKESRKREKREDALRDDRDTFSVVMGERVPAPTGGRQR